MSERIARAMKMTDETALLAISLHTADMRGDHAADVEIAIEPKPGETVDELVRRSGMGTAGGFDRGAFISIRRIEIRALALPAGEPSPR